jgi:hypothetical protein
MEPENREQREAYEKKEVRSLLSGHTIGTKANNNEELVTNGYLECDQEYMATPVLLIQNSSVQIV